MNYKMISYNIGRILLVEAALLVLPAIISIIYNDGVLLSFAVTIAALTATGLLATRKKPGNRSCRTVYYTNLAHSVISRPGIIHTS